MKISLVLFDLDGTLADSLPFIRSTYEKVFNEMGLNINIGEVMHLIGRPLEDIAKHFARDREVEFLKLYQYHYNIGHDQHVALFPGTLEILNYLKSKDFKLGIVTSKGSDGTRQTVEVTGLKKYMDVIVTAHDVNCHKPSPDPILKSLHLLNAMPEQAVYIGDSCFDIEAGKKAGTVTLGVLWGISSGEELIALKPDGILKNWDELKNFI